MWWPQCTFAMERINRDDPPGTKLFGSPRLQDAWLKAIVENPIAYARHRLAFFNALMTGRNMVMFDQSNSGQWRFFFVKRAPYVMYETAMVRLHEVTPIFRGATWLLLSVLVGIAGLFVANGRAKAAILALSSSGTLYALTYTVFGVAAEYRYVYWTALSGLFGLAFVLAKWEMDASVARRARRTAGRGSTDMSAVSARIETMGTPGREDVPRIAVLIPCYNEATTIDAVVRDFLRHLPGADVYVYDNNSGDETARIAARGRRGRQAGGAGRARVMSCAGCSRISTPTST